MEKLGLYDNVPDYAGDKQADLEQNIHEQVVQEIQGWNYARMILELEDCFDGIDWDNQPTFEEARQELIEKMVERRIYE